MLSSKNIIVLTAFLAMIAYLHIQSESVQPFLEHPVEKSWIEFKKTYNKVYTKEEE